MGKFDKKYTRVAVCKLKEGEIPVQGGLAYTPSKMMQLAQDGIPISTQTAAGVQYDDGYRKLDFEPLMEFRRGVDITDVWEADMDARQKVKNALKKPVYKTLQDANS